MMAKNSDGVSDRIIHPLFVEQFTSPACEFHAEISTLLAICELRERKYS